MCFFAKSISWDIVADIDWLRRSHFGRKSVRVASQFANSALLVSLRSPGALIAAEESIRAAVISIGVVAVVNDFGRGRSGKSESSDSEVVHHFCSELVFIIVPH